MANNKFGYFFGPIHSIGWAMLHTSKAVTLLYQCSDNIRKFKEARGNLSERPMSAHGSGTAESDRSQRAVLESKARIPEAVPKGCARSSRHVWVKIMPPGDRRV